MANFARFMTLLLIFVLLISTNLRANVSNLPTSPTETNVLCEAPPPDSFRITNYGGTFFALAWEPTWVGALHLLELKRQDASGNWIAERVFDNVPGDNFLIDSLIPGRHYRVYISTKCGNGDPSIFTVHADGGVIVELTLGGRTPKNPKVISCENISYDNFEWVGFRIAVGGLSRLFEVNLNEQGFSPYAYIRRISTQTDIVAVDGDGDYPIISNPALENVSIPFQLKQGEVSVGFLKIQPVLMNPPVFSLCQVLDDPNKPWNPNYTFKMLSAQEVLLSSPESEPTVGINDIDGGEPIRIENPVKDNLILFIPESLRDGTESLIQIWNMGGQRILHQQVRFSDFQHKLLLEGVASGFYLMEVKNKNQRHLLKIIKN